VRHARLTPAAAAVEEPGAGRQEENAPGQQKEDERGRPARGGPQLVAEERAVRGGPGLAVAALHEDADQVVYFPEGGVGLAAPTVDEPCREGIGEDQEQDEAGSGGGDRQIRPPEAERVRGERSRDEQEHPLREARPRRREASRRRRTLERPVPPQPQPNGREKQRAPNGPTALS
jgi:hypothetical protein